MNTHLSGSKSKAEAYKKTNAYHGCRERCIGMQ